MTAGAGDGFNSSRFSFLVLALVLIAVSACVFVPSVAFAQEQKERIGILNRLFGSKKAERVEPKAVVIRPKTKRKKAVRAPVDGDDAPQATVITKRPDAHVVLVIGDFLAGGLAEGLTTAFTQNPNVKIVDRTSGSSGFVRSDFHNWAEKINELITAEKPSAVVVMIGANDRQQMLVDGVRETTRSENWNREYAERASELAKAIAGRKIPFLWVGMPPFKSQKMMLDMLAFNEIYRAAATGAGGEFVDIWDGFVDENGAYVASGPDLNGQPARLRANDGINLARPGKRKVAFFAEKPLYKILGENPDGAGDPTAHLATRPAYRLFGPFGPSEPMDQAELDVVVDPNEAGPVNTARPIALRTPGLDGGVELLGAVAEPRREAKTPAERLVMEGIATAAPAGRADQFGWPQLASAATAIVQLNIDTTLNRAHVPSTPEEAVIDRAALRPVRSDVLTEPAPPMPARLPPELTPDRFREISPTQAAPDVAAAEPPMTTPSTALKGSVPDFAKGDPRDLSPGREVPRQAIKRPTSIGPEPNRAPTAVPQPLEEPAEAGDEIPSASLDGSTLGAEAEKPVRPDTAPPKAAVPSILPGSSVEPLAPAREVPKVATPVPVASLPAAKDAPSELVPAPAAPLVLAPNAPVEPQTELSAAKAVPAIETGEITGAAPARSAPMSENAAPEESPARAAPSLLPSTAESATPATPLVRALPEPAAQGIPQDGQQTSGPADVEKTTSLPTNPTVSATPVAPAAPTVLPAPPEEAEDPSIPGKEAKQSVEPVRTANPGLSGAAAPGISPEKAVSQPAELPGPKVELKDDQNPTPSTPDSATDVSTRPSLADTGAAVSP